MADSFELLGVSREAGANEVRRAYRELARRWHPDRFQEGPERMWAEEKMIAINNAYHEVLRQIQGGQRMEPAPAATPENAQLADARRLMELGQLSAARQALLRIATRDAEWNYLFGALLQRLGDYEKAVLYFGIATRQMPQNLQYRTALQSAEVIRDRRKGREILEKIMRPFAPRKAAHR